MLTSRPSLPYLSSVQLPFQSLFRLVGRLFQLPRDESNSSYSSFRRTRPPPPPIRSLLSSNIPIRPLEKEDVRVCLNMALLYKHGFAPPRNAKWEANRLVMILHLIDVDLAQKGLNPSILFTLYHNEARRRRDINTLIGFLATAKRSVLRDEMALSLLLLFAQHSSRYPIAFQKSLQMFMSKRRIPRNTMLQYFSRRKFLSHHIPFSSK